MDKHQSAQKRSAPSRRNAAVLAFANPCLQDAIRAQGHAKYTSAWHILSVHLPAGIADKKHGAVLFEQTRHALIVADTAVHEPHTAVGIKTIEDQRLEESGHA